MKADEVVDAAVRAAVAPAHPGVSQADVEDAVPSPRSGDAGHHGYADPGSGGGSGEVSVQGSSSDAEPVWSDRFRFVSGPNSNVVVRVDPRDRDPDGTQPVQIDVYYM